MEILKNTASEMLSSFAAKLLIGAVLLGSLPCYLMSMATST